MAARWDGMTLLKHRLKSSFQPAKLPSVPRKARYAVSPSAVGKASVTAENCFSTASDTSFA